MKTQMNLLASLATLLALSASAHADTRVETKIMQFGGPETRTRCIKEWKTKGIPECKVKGFEIRCKDTWMKGCSEWATDFYQHEIFLVASGPDVADELKKIVVKALERSVVAAGVAAAATPGEVAIKTGAAITAFKVTLAAELAVEPILSDMRDRFNIRIEERGSW